MSSLMIYLPIIHYNVSQIRLKMKISFDEKSNTNYKEKKCARIRFVRYLR